MKVRIRFPYGSQGWTRDTDLPAVPRVGDTVVPDYDGTPYLIREVLWNLWDTNTPVTVIVRRPTP